MNEAHDAIGKWMAANRRESAGQSWEEYGDPTHDPADTETTVLYLLKQRLLFFGRVARQVGCRRKMGLFPSWPQERSRRRRGRCGSGWRVILWPG